MKRAFTFLAITVLVLSAFICGESAYEKNDKFAAEVLATHKELEKTLQSVKDKESAKAAATKIDEICNSFEELTKRIKTIPRLPGNKKLESKYRAELEGIPKRLEEAITQAVENAEEEEAFMKSFQRLESVLNEMEKETKRP
jgi:DNA repair ATPase RecN